MMNVRYRNWSRIMFFLWKNGSFHGRSMCVCICVCVFRLRLFSFGHVAVFEGLADNGGMPFFFFVFSFFLFS